MGKNFKIVSYADSLVDWTGTILKYFPNEQPRFQDDFTYYKSSRRDSFSSIEHLLTVVIEHIAPELIHTTATHFLEYLAKSDTVSNSCVMDDESLIIVSDFSRQWIEQTCQLKQIHPVHISVPESRSGKWLKNCTKLEDLWSEIPLASQYELRGPFTIEPLNLGR